MTYEIVRSRRRTVALEVTREGRVVVRAPLRMTQGEIDRFVAAHADWLEKAKAKVAARQAAHPPLTEAEIAALRQRRRRCCRERWPTTPPLWVSSPRR